MEQALKLAMPGSLSGHERASSEKPASQASGPDPQFRRPLQKQRRWSSRVASRRLKGSEPETTDSACCDSRDRRPHRRCSRRSPDHGTSGVQQRDHGGRAKDRALFRPITGGNLQRPPWKPHRVLAPKRGPREGFWIDAEPVRWRSLGFPAIVLFRVLTKDRKYEGKSRPEASEQLEIGKADLSPGGQVPCQSFASPVPRP